MSTNPLGSPKFRAFDSNGDPLSGGKLYAYSAGTTNALDTFTTRAGAVANASPVVLDANGEADVWLSPGVDYKFVLKTSLDVTQWTVDSFPSAAESSASTDDVTAEPGGRITLTSGAAITPGDVTGSTTVYYTPYNHAKVPLYDGTNWAIYTIATELSQATSDATKSPAAVAVSSNYDLFVWNDSGTLRLSRGPAWTSATGRGTGAGTTETERLNGRLVNKVSISNGPAAQRGLYVGTVRSDASAQLNDSGAKRNVWNAYNRTARMLRATDATNNWEYHVATWRQAHATATNQVEMVRGANDESMSARVIAAFIPVGDVAYGAAGIGLDSTSALASGCINHHAGQYSDNALCPAGAEWVGFPGLGYHYLAWLEWGNGGADDIVWHGAFGVALSGIHGTCWA